MRIDDDHQYHGAALIQIAEDPQFTAINTCKVGKRTIRSAYRINSDIVVYLKYASKSKGSYGEYHFTFQKSHLDDLGALHKQNARTFVVLVCVQDREICCVPYDEFMKIVLARIVQKGEGEEQYTVIVTAQKGKQFRVYANAPGRKGKKIAERLVPRSSFPASIFT